MTNEISKSFETGMDQIETNLDRGIAEFPTPSYEVLSDIFSGYRKPPLGAVFHESYRAMGDNLYKNEEYQIWTPRKPIRECQPSDSEQTDYSVIFFSNVETRTFLEERVADDNLVHTLRRLGRKSTICHVARLLTHINCPACEDLAVATMKSLAYDVLNVFECIPDTLDGTASMQFWTFAPYIMEALRIQENLEAVQAHKAVLLWSSKRVPKYDFTGCEVGAQFPGIQDLGQKLRDGSYLSEDGYHQTHTFSWEVGKHIAHELTKH